MSEVLSQFFTWAVKDVIFFSGDVQTTTIAVAITSSLCCSIVVAVVHIIALIRPRDVQKARSKHQYKSHSKFSPTSKKYPPVWLSYGKVQVPCVRCGHFFADEGCRFVTCKGCCFSLLACQIHQRASTSSTPCENKQTEIDLSSVGMQACPERLGFIGHQLTCLNLSDNQLHELPSEIGCLRGLQVLSLQGNKLSSLPETISSLANLVCFDISHNEFQVFPGYISSLSSLQELNLSYNRLSLLPTTIALLNNLLVLDISHNNIPSLCVELFTLFQMKVLNINHNMLESVPAEVGRLIKLVSLDASNCQLVSLPSAIGNCSNLTTLVLNDNRLKRLPSRLGQLCKLQRLEVDRNLLQYLPYTLFSLHELLSLSVTGNPLLMEKDFKDFTRTPDPGLSMFPPLKEFTARKIIKTNIPATEILPTVLQELLTEAGSCSICGGPVCEFYQSEIVPVHFLFSRDWVPLYKQLCSPHKPQGCG